MDGFTETEQLNVLGERLRTCCNSPVTGFYRTGCCEVGGDDVRTRRVEAETLPIVRRDGAAGNGQPVKA